MFKKMTVGKQILTGFGVVLLFLAGMNVISITGVGNIVKNAVSMITGGEIRYEMGQHEINHLDWITHLVEFMNDKDKKELKIQTDDHKCGFGKWLYGKERKELETAVPGLAPFFKSMEKPHELLHHSAVDIAKKMNKLNVTREITRFYRAEIDHRKWVAIVIDETIFQKNELSVQLDYKKCNLGKWLYQGEADALAKEFPAFAPLIEEIKEPHRLIHDGGKLINARLLDGDYDSALELVKEKVTPQLQSVTDIFKKFRDLARKFEKDQQEAQKILVNITNKNMAEVQDLMHQVSGTVDKNMVTEEILLNGANKLKLFVTVIGITAFVLGCGLAFFISKGLVKSLSVITGSMSEGADQVASASGQVSSASQSLAEGASEQAASIEETSSSLEEMSSMTKQNADNAGQADNLMNETNQVVASASTSMTKLITSMEEISKASDETHKVVKTIDEIAFQTNLLALNAAVEAARAGEAGAGFAVVAEEVRNLALRSAEAAKNTAVLIDGTVKKVKEGSEIVYKTNDEFSSVSKSASKVAELVAEISAASNEQAQGIEQVNTAVAEMDKVVQQNAANAEESASASEELNAQAKQMKGMVGELMALVGRSKKGDAFSSAGAKAAEKKIRKENFSSSVKNNISRTIMPHSGQEASPSQIIPMDNDDDFADF